MLENWQKSRVFPFKCKRVQYAKKFLWSALIFLFLVLVHSWRGHHPRRGGRSKLALDISHHDRYYYYTQCPFKHQLLQRNQAKSAPRRQRGSWPSETLFDHNWNRFVSHLHHRGRNPGCGAYKAPILRPATNLFVVHGRETKKCLECPKIVSVTLMLVYDPNESYYLWEFIALLHFCVLPMVI